MLRQSVLNRSLCTTVSMTPGMISFRTGPLMLMASILFMLILVSIRKSFM